MKESLRWNRKTLKVKDRLGFVSTYVCIPKEWAKQNLGDSTYVQISMLSDGSLRLVPVEDTK
jgi:hypothetical protein